VYLVRLGKMRLLVIIALFVAGTFVYTASNRLVDQKRVDNDYDVLVNEISILRESKTELEKVRDFAMTDLFVEQQARLLLGMAREGETSFVIINKHQ